MFHADQFKTVLAASALTVAEAAQVYGVSRQTVYEWLGRGKAPSVPRPDSIQSRMAESITVALAKAVERRLLPFPSLSREDRKRRVASLASRAQQLRPASR